MSDNPNILTKGERLRLAAAGLSDHFHQHYENDLSIAIGKDELHVYVQARRNRCFFLRPSTSNGFPVIYHYGVGKARAQSETPHA